MRLETPNWLASKGGARVRHWALRRIDPWSTLKFSLLFYLAIAIVLVLTSFVLYAAASVVHVGSSGGGDAQSVRQVIERVIQSVGWPDWKLTAGRVVGFTSLLGLAFVIIWSGVTVCLALLYNLICDVVGGVELTVTDKDA